MEDLWLQLSEMVFTVVSMNEMHSINLYIAYLK